MMNNLKRKLRKQSNTIASRGIKYLGISLTKEMRDLYTKNYKTLLKKIQKMQINRKPPPICGLGDLILVNCSY